MRTEREESATLGLHSSLSQNCRGEHCMSSLSATPFSVSSEGHGSDRLRDFGRMAKRHLWVPFY
jgi:hypothetical protein